MRSFTVREKDLAAGLLPGEVMLARVQKLRAENLKEGHDFVKVGKVICYSTAGVEKLAELIRLDAGSQVNGTDGTHGTNDKDGPGAGVALPAGQELMEGVLAVLPKKRVRVVKVFATNPQYLHAMTVDGKDGLLTVRVRDNRHFLPGMEMDVMKSVGGVWDYVGHLPRARGRW